MLAWDLFNEPDNDNANSYGPLELKNKDEVAERLVRLSFQWARAVGPVAAAHGRRVARRRVG